jgi:outer membrane protein assembly factor BamB
MQLARDKFRLFLAIGFSLVIGAIASASPWPRFRGPNGTGIATDKSVPVHWTDREGLLWKTAIPGQGNSSAIVWEDRVFLQSAGTDGKERLLLCLNTVDGKVVWSRSLPGSPARKHPKNTLASSTPATDGARVYALFWDGQEMELAAYDFHGNLCWKSALGHFTSQHGPGTSPIVHGGKVFLANDQDGTAMLHAVDAQTGKTAWQAPRRAFRACYSTPFILEKPGAKPELIVTSTAGITSYDPDAGTQNWDWHWTFSGMPLRTVASSAYSPGLIFANSGDGSGDRHAVALDIGPNGNGAGPTPHPAWEKKKGFPYVPTSLAWGDHLFFVNDDGFASCLAARTGETIWNERLGGKVSASPVLIDGKIYAVNEEGTFFVFPAEPTFRLLARNQIGEPVMATPAVADGRLFVRGKTHLFCIAKSPGRTTE